MADQQNDDQTPRSGRCALLGRPNVGKSTLLNRLLGQKLVIATPTPGTTRSCVLGVYASDDPPTQIAFLDTPGMGKQRNALANMLREQTKTGLSEVDVVVLMTDVRPKQRGEVHSGDDTALRLAEASERPVILAINKVDLLRDKRQLLPLIQAYEKRLDFVAYVPVSAEKGTNLGDLVDEIRARLPEGLMYDEDFLTDRPERFFVAELVREAALSHTREEVPHGVAVVIDEYDEQGDMVRVHATVVVERESHKGIVIGAKGTRLKQIGTDARVEIERFLGRKVFLKLWVKVVPGWTGDPHKARRLVDEGTT